MRTAHVLWAIAWTACACDGSSEPDLIEVGPEDITKEAVTADVRAEVIRRLESTGVEAATIRAELLIWEVRQVEGRDGASDLAIAWTSHQRGGVPEWSFGQLFRHRLGAEVSWRWEVVRDESWFNPTVYEQAPGNGDFAAFAKYWDFESMGQNGRLLAADLDEAQWSELLGTAPDMLYPAGTPAPEDL